jgi:3-oxoacyl-[acyl-carrier-protein] synthase III
MIAAMTGFTLAGSGIYRPASARNGRPVANAGETSSAMATAAAEYALSVAGWSAADLDVLIGACSVMEQPIPGTAILVQRRLGIGASGIAAFDVNATCLSGLLALDLATTGIAAGKWRRALIVTADLPSAAVDPTDAALGPIFGDGAAALAVEAGEHRILASRFESYGDHADLCRLEAGGTRVDPRGDRDEFLAATRFRMDGAALYRKTSRLFPAFLDRLLGAAGIAADDIDLIVPHQASGPAIDHLAHALGGSRDRIIDIFAHHGNQVASSLPHALHVAATTGRLTPGSTVLLIGSAAGITLGGMVLRW